jgi:uncharacterized RDD family membrane protein YckC
MTQIPAGWYPDPAPDTAPGRQRYWDGAQWTEHVHDPQPAPPVPSYPPTYPSAYPQTAPQAPQYVGPPTKVVPTTPDGQPLAGWWRRVLAVVLDWFIKIPIYAIAVVPVIAANWGELETWFDETVEAADAGTEEPPLPDFIDPLSAEFLTMSVLVVLLTAAYTLGFWRWKQATPGKLIVGIRIRRREQPGPMPWGTMLIRLGVVQLLGVATSAPFVGALFLLALALNYLWPLWDKDNQALHDKVARTNVVLAQPAADQPATEAGSPPRW